MIEIPTAVTVAIYAYAVVAALGAVLLVAAVTNTLLAERQVRVARDETIAHHYLGLARSH